MSLIRKSEIKQMNEVQIKNKLEELRKEMMKINTQLSTHTTPENPGRIRLVKKTIAKLLTKIHNQKKTEEKSIEKKEVKKETKAEPKKTAKKKLNVQKVKTGGKKTK